MKATTSHILTDKKRQSHLMLLYFISIDHFHNDVKQSLKARRNIEYEKGDVPNSVCIGNCFEAEIRIQI